MKKVLRTYKYKLNPTKTQENIFESWLGICRFTYNSSLALRINYINLYKKQPSSFDLNYQLNEAKKEPKLNFLKEVHSDVLTEANERTKKTVDNLFRMWKIGKKATPRFKNKYTYNSFTYKRGVKVEENKIKLPKIGFVKYNNSRSLPKDSKIKYCTITKKNNKWYISIQVEFQQKVLPIDESQAVGIDVGIEVHSYKSNGTFTKGNYALEKSLKKLRVINRKLSRCKKGSKRRKKIKYQLSKLHEKVSNQRSDFNHKLSTDIAKEFDIVCIEDLKISNMTKLNSTLARRMLDNGFYQFRLMLEYKAKEVVAVNPAYTSQKCSSCGSIDSRSRLSQSEFVCTSCGNIDQADFNASKNIKAQGMELRTKRKAVA